MKYRKIKNYIVIFFCFFLLDPGLLFSYPLTIKDVYNNSVSIKKTPKRVVSLIPSITEMIFRLGAGDAVCGITYHSTYPPETAHKKIIGGYFEPSLKEIKKLNPDMIFVSDIHKEVKDFFSKEKCLIIKIDTKSIADSFSNIKLIGEIFDKKKQAEKYISDIKKNLDVISEKISKIPDDKRKRVIRLMGRKMVMTPGKDSFQNEMIRAAGGITHDFNKNGNIIEVSKEQWIKFNPQIIYGCGNDRKTAKLFFNKAGWSDVDAVKNGKIYYYPCDLTCRASTNTGYFVGWLASNIYGKEFFEKKAQVFKDSVIKNNPFKIDLEYIENAGISESMICDFKNRTLLINFKNPLSVVSTLAGHKTGIKTIGNHYTPPQNWGIGHVLGLKGLKKQVFNAIKVKKETACFLFTGADLNNLAIKKEKFKDLEVHALVTAGVRSNAMRMSKDTGGYYEPGTINIIIMTNMKLTSRAMTRAIISATEGKTAALLDMDIRSSYNKKEYRATGTGTDNIIVVEGTGTVLDNAGGHTKLGELIATAVSKGVKDAVYKQNSIITRRNIFQRLKERGINIYSLFAEEKCDCGRDKSEFAGVVEEILIDPVYAGFIEIAMGISDDYEKGLIKDLSLFNQWSKNIAENIAGKEIKEMKTIAHGDNLTIVMSTALNAILNGVYYRTE